MEISILNLPLPNCYVIVGLAVFLQLNGRFDATREST